MKRLGVIVVVLACLLLAADFGLRVAAENAAAELIDKEIARPVEPEVGLGGFPFLLSLLRGTFDEVTIEVPEASEGRLVVEDIRLTLEDVELEALEVLGGRGNLFAKSLHGNGVISEEGLNEIIDAQAPGVEVAITTRRVTLSRDGVSVPATAVVAGNRLLISGGELVAPFEVPLPALLAEIQFSTLRAEPNRLVLGVIGSKVRIRT